MSVALVQIIAPLDLQKDGRKFHGLRQKSHNLNRVKATIDTGTDNVKTPTVKVVVKVVVKAVVRVGNAAVGHNRSRP
jgi:hypothetical protein